jgi:Protein of unknown function (DUF998)
MDTRVRHVTARLMGPLTVPVTTVGVGVFVLATIAAHLAHPELSPLVEPVSLYARGAGGWLMATAFIAIGLTGLWISAVATGLTRAGRACLALWSAGALAGAAFPIDASDAPATISGMIHQLAGFNFVVVIAAALLFGRSFRRRLPGTWARRVGSSAWLLTASGILLVVFMGPLHNLHVGGVAQRSYWVALLIWLLVVSRAIADHARSLREAPAPHDGRRSSSPGAPAVCA